VRLFIKHFEADWLISSATTTKTIERKVSKTVKYLKSNNNY